jgi:hypothetical protein
MITDRELSLTLKGESWIIPPSKAVKVTASEMNWVVTVKLIKAEPVRVICVSVPAIIRETSLFEIEGAIGPLTAEASAALKP